MRAGKPNLMCLQIHSVACPKIKVISCRVCGVRQQGSRQGPLLAGFAAVDMARPARRAGWLHYDNDLGITSYKLFSPNFFCKIIFLKRCHHLS